MYALAHPPLTRRCTALLERVASGRGATGEDLASDALTRLLFHPTVGRRVRPTSDVSLLAFLQRVAWCDYLDGRELRAARELGIATERLDPAALSSLPAALASTSSVAPDAFWPTYRLALTQLPDVEQRAWCLCVEQEVPVAEVATALGLHRTTMWRHVQSAAAHLRLNPALHELNALRTRRSTEVAAPAPVPAPVRRAR